MSTQILFRSLRSGRDRSGSALPTIRQRGSIWSHLRPYTDTDDIRDIAWGRIRPDGLTVRARETHGDYHILSYWGSTPYDDFSTGDLDLSRRVATDRARHTIAQSARFGQHSYEEYSGATGLEYMIKMKPKNTLIFISNTEITDDIELLAYHNDVIYIDLTHSYESDPDTHMLFSGQVLDIRAYREAYQLYRENKKNTIKKIQASYISLLTTADISDILNTFFKKRYTNG